MSNADEPLKHCNWNTALSMVRPIHVGNTITTSTIEIASCQSKSLTDKSMRADKGPMRSSRIFDLTMPLCASTPTFTTLSSPTLPGYTKKPTTKRFCSTKKTQNPDNGLDL
jgi:hypothetical protein